MKLKKIAFALLLAALLCCGCGETKNPGPAPNLEGHWTQTSPPPRFYQTAVISGGEIEVFWHLTEDGSEYLYWSGSFEPPKNGKEPYTWVSNNNFARAATDPHCRREETLTFTYKEGKISFVQIQGRIHMGVALEKDA